MNILLCCEYYLPSVGGVQEVMRQIAERLALKGHSVAVATSSNSKRSKVSSINGVCVYSFDVSGNSVKGLRGEVGAYKSHLLETHYDVILINAAQQWTFDAIVDIFPEVKAQKYFIPCGFSCLRDSRYQSYYQAMPQWLDMFDGLIFATQYYQDYEFALKHSRTPRYLIPNGVDEREFVDLDSRDIRRILSVSQEENLLLAVGSLLRSKGHWEVLHAYASANMLSPSVLIINGNAHRKNVCFIFLKQILSVFKGQYPLWLHLFLLRFSLSRQCKRVLIVDLPRDQVVSLFKAADLFVFPSHVEYSPLVLFEAAASATPFVSSQAGNSDEIASLTGAGLTVPPISRFSARVQVSDLARAIEFLLADRGRLRRMGENGRAAIYDRRLTWDALVDRYAALLCGHS